MVKAETSQEGEPSDASGTGEKSVVTQRIRAALGGVDNLSAFSREIGVGLRTLNRYLHEGAEPGATNLARIARGLGVSLDRLVHGEDAEPSGGSVAGEWDGYVMVPRFNVLASAGPGRAAQPEQGPAEIAVQEAFLRQLGIIPSNAQFLTAKGDSMRPTIEDGDLLLLNRGAREVEHGRIYVLVVAGEVLLKRLHRMADGSLNLTSDNRAAYPDDYVPRDEVDRVQIEGRVRWYGRSL